MSNLSGSVSCNICLKLLKFSGIFQKQELLEFSDQNKQFHHFLQHLDSSKQRLVQKESELSRKFRCCFPRECFNFRAFQLHCGSAPTENQVMKIPDKIWCKLCSADFQGPKIINKNEKQISSRLTHWKDSHIMKHHIKEYVFECKHCSYGSREYSCSNIKSHLRYQHPKSFPLEYIDRRRILRPKIDQLKIECFGYPKNEVIAASSKKVPKDEGIWCNLCKSNFEAPNKRNLSRWKQKHVIDNHLRKATFECSYCEYRNYDVGSSRHIVRHITFRHKEKAIRYKNLFKSLRPEIDELKMKCFGAPPLPKSISQTEKGRGIWCAVCKSDFEPPSKVNRQNLCGWKFNHILRKHLNRPIFECVYCSKILKNTSRSNEMKFHVRRNHRNEKMMFRSNLSALGPEIDNWMNECFGKTTDYFGEK